MNRRDLPRILAVHDALAGIYADRRWPARPDTRALAVTLIWVGGVERPPRGQRWPRVYELLHLNDYQMSQLILADLPRWEPPAGSDTGTCEVSLPRAGRPCGRPWRVSFRVTAPDGTWRHGSWCSRHTAEAAAAEAAEHALQAAGAPPEPLPDTGGLLPCHVPNIAWARLYRWTCPEWVPPAEGIRADGWQGRTPGSRPALSVLQGASEAGDAAACPALRAVT